MAWNKHRHCVNHVNRNWKLTVIFLSLFCLLPINGQDFQFETNTDDDLHVSIGFEILLFFTSLSNHARLTVKLIKMSILSKLRNVMIS